MNELQQELEELKKIRDNIDKKYKTPIHTEQIESKSIFDDINNISKDIDENEHNYLFFNEKSTKAYEIMMTYFNLWNFQKYKKEFELKYPQQCKDYVDIIKENKKEYKLMTINSVKEKDAVISKIEQDNKEKEVQLAKISNQNAELQRQIAELQKISRGDL